MSIRNNEWSKANSVLHWGKAGLGAAGAAPSSGAIFYAGADLHKELKNGIQDETSRY